VADPVFFNLDHLPPGFSQMELAYPRTWLRLALACYLMARTGISTRQDLAQLLADRLGIQPDAGSIRRLLWNLLPDSGLVNAIPLPLVRLSQLSVLQLTDRGRDLARLIGQEPIESDWQRLCRLHQGETDRQHAAVILAFAYQARRRGWSCQVIPSIGQGMHVYPDACLRKGAEKIYVEIERRQHGHLVKWHKYLLLQHYVAICAFTPEGRRGLVGELKRAGVKGRATDIETLIKGAKTIPMGELWAEWW
jgi:hypothetical protein